MANHGLTPTEIAEDLTLPPSLAAEWHTRGYYGTLSHNAKAVYQRYLGWFDGNPANLHKLPPADAGAKYVEVAGGADALLKKARESYDRGEYRWVAELVNQGAVGQLRALPADALLESFAVRLNGLKAGAVGDLALTVAFSDTGERFAVSVENAVLHHKAVDGLEEGGPAVTLTRPALIGLVIGETTLDEAIGTGAVSGEGVRVLGQLLPLLDRFDFWFEIVAP
jgi:alkyl sulfatase BDS1-like metallo-beta-lactamase superfamily hydrolase